VGGAAPEPAAAAADGVQVLVVRAGGRTCAIPLASVVETMRSLPARPIAGVPPYVLGVALVRGEPLPVVDVERLLGGEAAPRLVPAAPGLARGERAGRLVTVRAGGARRVALALDEVAGVRTVDRLACAALAPLLGGAAAGAVAGLGALDRELLAVLDASRLLEDAGFAAVDAAAADVAPEATS